MNEIMTFDTRFAFNTATGLPWTRPELEARFPTYLGDVTPSTGDTRIALGGGGQLIPEILESRWVVHCPTSWCAGAELMSSDGNFYCMSGCRNVEYGHDYLPVQLPDPDERAQVETLLLYRVNPAARNFQTGETVDDIIAENEAEGLPTS